MKYAFIQRHRRVWPISVQCRVLGVSVSGYHEHFVRRASDAQRRHLSDDALLVHIKAIHAETRGGYGWPRTWKELLARGGSDLHNRWHAARVEHTVRATFAAALAFTSSWTPRSSLRTVSSRRYGLRREKGLTTMLGTLGCSAT